MPRVISYRRKTVGKISSKLSSNKSRRVAFYTTKGVTRTVPISFSTKAGKKVSFAARKRTDKRVRVNSYSRKGKSRPRQ
jgi:hypothetical protein